MSGSGMIAARPEGLAVDMPGEPEGCPSGWCPPERFDGFMAFAPGATVTVDDKSEPGSWARALAERGAPVIVGIDYASDYIAEQRAFERCNVALGIIMLAAAKCTEVQALADCGRIDRDGADLFNRRYSESICEIVAELAPVLPKGSN